MVKNRGAAAGQPTAMAQSNIHYVLMWWRVPTPTNPSPRTAASSAPQSAQYTVAQGGIASSSRSRTTVWLVGSGPKLVWWLFAILIMCILSHYVRSIRSDTTGCQCVMVYIYTVYCWVVIHRQNVLLTMYSTRILTRPPARAEPGHCLAVPHSLHVLDGDT